MYKKALSLVAVAVIAISASTAVSAAPKVAVDDKKITICHRTNAVKNPYVKITVDQSAADGIAGNSGNEADHFGEHQGPLASSEGVAQGLKDAKTEWGDIIPPITGVHGGLNWTAEGQAIYNNGDCEYTTPGMGGGGGTTVGPSGSVTPPAPQVAAPAQGQGVNAGGGSALPSLVALLGSVVAFGYGILRFRKLNI